MKLAAAAMFAALAATAALAAPQGLRVPGGDPGPSAFTLAGLEVQPPEKRTDGKATVRILVTKLRPSVQLDDMEVKLLYAEKGFGGSGHFRRDAPQPRNLPAGAVRYIAYPDTARLGCMDALQPRQIVVLEYSEGDRRMSEAYLMPFEWYDPYPTLDGHCHIPGH